QDQEVINQVSGLRNERTVGIFRGDNCLRRFFTDLLQNLVEPAVEQISRITSFRTLFLSLLDDGIQFLKHALHSRLRAKTRIGSRVAGRTARFDFNEDSILITIETHLHDLLRVAGGFAFMPQLLPASAPEICFTLLEGELERF